MELGVAHEDGVSSPPFRDPSLPSSLFQDELPVPNPSVNQNIKTHSDLIIAKTTFSEVFNCKTNCVTENVSSFDFFFENKLLNGHQV